MTAGLIMLLITVAACTIAGLFGVATLNARDALKRARILAAVRLNCLETARADAYRWAVAFDEASAELAVMRAKWTAPRSKAAP